MSEHAKSQLSELLDRVASDSALFQADTNCHAHLWKEEGLGTGRGRKGNVSDGFSSYSAAGINTLSLKAKACTPSVYRYIGVC